MVTAGITAAGITAAADITEAADVAVLTEAIRTIAIMGVAYGMTDVRRGSSFAV